MVIEGQVLKGTCRMERAGDDKRSFEIGVVGVTR